MDLCYIHYNAALPGGIDLFDAYDIHRAVIPKHAALTKELFRTLTDAGIREVPVPGRTPGDAAPADADGGNAVGNPANALFQEGIIKVILSDCLTHAKIREQRRSVGMSRFAAFFAFVDENLHRDLTLSQMAETAALHPTYFSNLFTRTMGLPPTAYLRRKRIDRAAILLAFQDDTLETIARETGFCDAFHLSKVFKELAGQSPRTFRDRVRSAGAL